MIHKKSLRKKKWICGMSLMITFNKDEIQCVYDTSTSIDTMPREDVLIRSSVLKINENNCLYMLK